MLPFLILTILLAATSAVANKLAGKYQALFFYHVYRLDVEAYGLANCHLASAPKMALPAIWNSS